MVQAASLNVEERKVERGVGDIASSDHLPRLDHCALLLSLFSYYPLPSFPLLARYCPLLEQKTLKPLILNFLQYIILSTGEK